MSHFDDMSPNDYFGRWEDILLSIGWLDDARAFPQGEVSTEFFRALVQLLVEPWQPGVLAGRAECAICQFSGGPGVLTFEANRIQLGSANLFVPGPNGKVFVSPSLVAHYVDAHRYVPPEEFQRAVIECPTMGTLPYRKALFERGLRVGSR